MKKIGFIGAYDKSNFIMYLSKILQLMGNKILVVDTTKVQKMKYIIPSIAPTKSYITSFENIDFAVGFESAVEIEKYLGTIYGTNEEEEKKNKKEEKNEKNDYDYDYILMDIDSSEKLELFDAETNDMNYFVTGFDNYSLKRGLSIFEHIKMPMNITRVFFSYENQKEEEEYFDYLSMEYKIACEHYIIYFPIQGVDNQVFEDNQRLDKIQYRRLSAKYKDALIYMVQDIIKDSKVSEIRKVMKD